MYLKELMITIIIDLGLDSYIHTYTRPFLCLPFDNNYILALSSHKSIMSIPYHCLKFALNKRFSDDGKSRPSL